MSLSDLIRKGPAGVGRPAGEESQLSQLSASQAGANTKPLRPSARLKAGVSQLSQESQSQTPVNHHPPTLPSYNNNNNNKVIIYSDTRAGEKSELTPFATVTVATIATDTARLWDIRAADGWLEVATCPPASLAMMQARYPEALEILPAPEEEEDPGTAFYHRLFAGMDAPRASITLSPAEAHQAVIAGLVTPEDTRLYTLLAYRTPESYGLMAIDKARWDGMQFLEILTAPDGLQ